MPENNPIVRGVHVSAYAHGSGGGVGPEAVETLEAVNPSANSGTGYNVSFVALMVIAIVVLFLLRAAGFKFVVSGSIGK